MPDRDQQRVVEAFGQERAKVRLLVASDVGSEGINLHFQSHRLIHFDVPWSLMVFQQRNGRVDRYGQEQRPEIYYLLSQSSHPKIRGDARILELLIDKEEEATKNIGDPAALMGKYEQEAEETATGKAMEDGATPEAFAASWTPDAAFDPLEFLLQGAAPVEPTLAVTPTAMASVFRDAEAFLVAALDELTASKRTRSRLDVRRTEEKRFIEFSMPDDLARRYRRVPAEVPNPEGRVQLTADPAVMQLAIRAARSNEAAWPELQYLWELHPAVTWARDRMRSLFGRHEAPIIDVSRLAKDERVLIVSGLIPNRRGQPVVHRWYGAVFRGEKFERLEDLDELLARTKLGSEPLANSGGPPGGLQKLVAEAVKRVRERVIEVRAEEEKQRAARLDQVRAELAKLRSRREQQLELALAGRKAQRDQEQRNVKRTFEEFEAWVQDTLATEPQPFLQVIAALRGLT